MAERKHFVLELDTLEHQAHKYSSDSLTQPLGSDVTEILDQISLIRQMITSGTFLKTDEDELLNELSAAAERLGRTAQGINSELTEQNQLLDTMGTTMDDELHRMGYIMRKTGEILGTANYRQIVTILWLLAAFIVLLILVII